MVWTPNKVTLLRVVVGFLAVSAFGHGAWMNLLGVALTVAAIALDALDGHIARRRKMATPVGAQLDILGDRVIENMFFTYFAVVGMVSLWLPMLFFARGAATDFLRGLAMKAGYSGWGANAMLQSGWAKALVASRWSRGLYAAMKCACFCYLGLELALTHGPVALLGPVTLDIHAAIRAGAQTLAWKTGVFCVERGLPVLVEGWRFLASNLANGSAGEEARGDVGCASRGNRSGALGRFSILMGRWCRNLRWSGGCCGSCGGRARSRGRTTRDGEWRRRDCCRGDSRRLRMGIR